MITNGTLKDSNKNSDKVDKIDFEELIKEYKVENVNIFVAYLKEIFRDLSERSENKSQGLTSITFSKYYELPGIISQRLFAVFDVGNNGYLDILEFIEGMVCLFTQNFDHLAKFIFNFYDFDKDQLISREDVRTVLSYIPLNTKNKVNSFRSRFEKETFKDRIESQEELHCLLEKAFGDKEQLNLEEFMNIVENVCSDIFLFVLIFLYENRPFTKTTLLNYQLAKSRIAHLSKSPHLITINKKIASPSLNSKFSPCIAISKSPVMTKKILGLDHSFTNKAKNDLLKKLGKKSDQIDGDSKNILLKYLPRAKTGEVNSNLITQLTDNPINSIKESEKENVADNFKNIPVIRKNRHNLKNFDNLGTTQYFCITDKTDSDMLITPAVKYKSEGRVKYSTKELDELIAQVNIKEENESESNEVKYEGYLFKITNTRKLKRLWFKLLHKDLYYYKNSEETIHKGMHNISGVFVNEENTVLYDTLRLYCFSVIYPKKSRFYYTDSEEEYKQWIDALRKATGYKNLTEIYDIGEKLGNGKFGLVRLGIHKETGRKVAVKIMNKTQMNELDLDLVKTEIEILKICQHPNIIRLYDIFENINYIYIIMEYCAGGDLFSYIENRGFRLPELRTAQIIHKLCAAVYYLHSYGIAHRDLKPENILMTDNTDTADIKLVDFGLSKIIGPNEYCNEPFGTLSYVAPEVLLEKPYTKAVDMWSIGVITYLLLSGSLPFDHQTSDKEIARQTIYDPVRFPFQIWRKNSLEARAFIENLLQKDPARRMTITQVLEHSWFQKYNMNELRLKSKDFGGSTFKFYTTVEESVKTS